MLTCGDWGEKELGPRFGKDPVLRVAIEGPGERLDVEGEEPRSEAAGNVFACMRRKRAHT